MNKTQFSMKLIPLFGLLLVLATSCQTAVNPTEETNDEISKTGELRKKIEKIVANKKAVVGVSLIGNNGKDTLSLNGDRRFPMQSVFKFHIALAVLSEIDKGKLSLNQKITIRKDELLPEDAWNPLRDEHPEGGTFTIKELICSWN